MTCIVGVEVGNCVVITGDIQGSGGNSKVVHTQPKVFMNNGMGIGYTSSYRFGQLLEHSLDKGFIPTDPNSIYPWLVKEFSPHCIKTLESNGYSSGGVCLIGICGQLWEMQGDYSFLRSTKGFNAVGSGQEYALGAMDVYFGNDDVSTMGVQEVIDITSNVIKTVSNYCPSVGSDATSIVVKK